MILLVIINLIRVTAAVTFCVGETVLLCYLLRKLIEEVS